MTLVKNIELISFMEKFNSLSLCKDTLKVTQVSKYNVSTSYSNNLVKRYNL